MMDGARGNSPIFAIDKVQLMFSLDNITSLVVSNNILCIALKVGRIIRIDLDHPDVVDDVDLPKKSSETGQIKDIYLDPTGSYLLITTTLGDNYCLHCQSTKPKLLSKLKGSMITSVGWCPTDPTRSTGEILLGTSGGIIYEALIEPSNEYFKREDRYVKQVWYNETNDPITGLVVYDKRKSGHRCVLASSKGVIRRWEGGIERKPTTEAIPVYPKYFDRHEPVIEEFEPSPQEVLCYSPQRSAKETPTHYAWLNLIGIMHGSLSPKVDNSRFFKESTVLLNDQLQLKDQISSILLTDYHIIVLAGKDVYAVNRINNRTVFHESISCEQGETILGLSSDHRYSTFWAYSNVNIYEIKVVGDEDREIWKTMLESGDYEGALSLAKDPYSKDVVSMAYGEELLRRGNYLGAARYLGVSSRPFESAALIFIENKQLDALEQYLSVKLDTVNKGSKMQRTIIASWMIELFMERLNSLDDLSAANSSAAEVQEDLESVRKQYQKFVEQYKGDLDRDTVYEIISAHNRKEELLHYASAINDGGFVLSYWTRKENWKEALRVLRTENDPRLTYKYATVLLVNDPKETVDTWMRISNLEPAKLIPAILSYVSSHKSKGDNQAIRYLKYAIKTLGSQDPVVFNTLISIYASNTAMSEAPLLAFLEEYHNSVFDFDFALRMCAQFNRIQCSVYIYSAMGLYEEAVNLALKKGETELAASVADKPINDPELRKSLWLQVARKVVSGTNGVESAVALLDRCDLLKIEDLLPLFPDFTVIDSFKEQVTLSLEEYNNTISQLTREMEESIATSSNVKDQISKFKRHYALIEPGEGCGICTFPLATRRFYVFPCQHAFHFDCLLDSVSKSSDYDARQRINEIQLATGGKELTSTIEEILCENCILCSDVKVDSIDKPLISQADTNSNLWSL
ncbi:hypothetical protein TRICI_004443 [Trichomonascus ciferrii]|uniref:Uncharacterized protein n=1 Tax=Trichomonascus ciferrii TaxID=44093 RepID=A0A642V119_9ASCO|nr:hypothetical protein TRICI_004443 [Trichomonascus ciferrii]